MISLLENKEYKDMKKETVVRVILYRINEIGEPEILLGKRAKHKNFPGKWEQPGGKVDEGEKLATAAVREVKEEIDIDINQNSLELIYEELAVSCKYNKKYDIKYFLASVSSDTVAKLIEPTKTSEWKWFKYDKLPEREELISYGGPEKNAFLILANI